GRQKEGPRAGGMSGGKKRNGRGGERHREMWQKKKKNEPFESELPMEVWDEAPPAPPLAQVKERRIALVTTSGVVPWGNPDRFKTYRNTHWRKYTIAELKELEPGTSATLHPGYNAPY